ncbi:hypothetical protein DKT69_22015 [Micromonospora sicca]|uniref:Uncharacterized protein n=1 Tax=Micromonospora sicca TaxID=2202420 RepID=A0A317DF83_9ACTN|nr:hypothetical protein DKT69_22015 [Micromonospora sp. 4G51]
MLPKACGVALVVVGAVTLVPLPVDGPAYEVIIGIAFAFAFAGVRAFGLRAPVPLATAQPAA